MEIACSGVKLDGSLGFEEVVVVVVVVGAAVVEGVMMVQTAKGER